MKCSLFVFALFASLLVLSGCDASGTGEEEELTLSPDVLDVQVEEGQVRYNPPYLLVNLTNTSDHNLSEARAGFFLWDGDTQVYDIASNPEALPSGTRLRDSLSLILLEDLSDFDCYTYEVSVTPYTDSGNLGGLTEKTYAGTCPDDHPFLR